MISPETHYPKRFKGGKRKSCMGEIIAALSARIKAKGRDKCILPQKMSKELAEEFGIHVGDGHMSFKKCPGKYTFYNYSTSSGANELDYVLNCIRPLMKKLYNLEVKVCHKRSNEIALHYRSKALYTFKSALGLPSGKKDTIEIPGIILNSPYITDFLRGLFDTDGCLQFKDRNKKAPPYPRLDIAGKSKKLIEQVNTILIDLGFTTSFIRDIQKRCQTDTICFQSRVFIYGKKNLKKWVELIGFSNPKNLRKLEDWRKKSCVEW